MAGVRGRTARSKDWKRLFGYNIDPVERSLSNPQTEPTRHAPTILVCDLDIRTGLMDANACWGGRRRLDSEMAGAVVAAELGPDDPGPSCR